MKRLIIGDTHGLYDVVEKIYFIENPDEVIMLGDYFDSHYLTSSDIIVSFNKLLKLREYHLSLQKGNFIMLLGNHELHYILAGAQYTGYDYNVGPYAYAKINECIENNIIQILYVDSNIKTLYSHAGVSNEWITKVLKQEVNTFPIECVNEVSLQRLGINHLSGYNSYGDTPTQSPVWIRPKSLLLNAYSPYGITWTQIVGHTYNERISSLGNIYICDTLPNEYLIENIYESNNRYEVNREIKTVI